MIPKAIDGTFLLIKKGRSNKKKLNKTRKKLDSVFMSKRVAKNGPPEAYPFGFTEIYSPGSLYVLVRPLEL